MTFRAVFRRVFHCGLIAVLLPGCAALKPTAQLTPAAAAAPVPEVAAIAPSPGASGASGPSRTSTMPVVTTSNGLRPFAEVVKDAKRIDGVFTVWQRDDRVWLEIKPGDLNQPFFLSPKLKSGIGEGFFLGGLMGEEVVVEFRRVHNQMQLLARNTQFIAPAKSPTGRAVESAFSPSLLASTMVLSQPHPDRKSVLVEANALFINDMLGTATALQRHFRQGYSLDARNSAITAVRASPDLVVLEVLTHFATGAVSAPMQMPGRRAAWGCR